MISPGQGKDKLRPSSGLVLGVCSSWTRKGVMAWVSSVQEVRFHVGFPGEVEG